MRVILFSRSGFSAAVNTDEIGKFVTEAAGSFVSRKGQKWEEEEEVDKFPDLLGDLEARFGVDLAPRRLRTYCFSRIFTERCIESKISIRGSCDDKSAAAEADVETPPTPPGVVVLLGLLSIWDPVRDKILLLGVAEEEEDTECGVLDEGGACRIDSIVSILLGSL